MTLKSFLKYVEIQTKAASVIPFILGTLYAVYRFNSFHPYNFIIMFISLICFDMATTAINNYIEYKELRSKEGSTTYLKNVIIKENISHKAAQGVIFVLLFIASISGILLTFKTDMIVLVIGVLSFMVGILYTFGPIPISRMPLGEIFSGFFMGFVIIFLAVYVEAYDKGIVLLSISHGILSLNIKLIEVIYIFLFAIPAMGGIANIMLANNICDLEEDIKNNRFTLPYYLGREKSLILFKLAYYIGYIDIVILAFLRVLPLFLIFTLFTIVPVGKGIMLFMHKQSKKETFVVSVRNFILINGVEALLLALVIVYKLIIK